MYSRTTMGALDDIFDADEDCAYFYYRIDF